MHRLDFSLIRSRVIALSCVVLLSGAIVAPSLYYLVAIRNEKREMEMELRSTRSNIARLQGDVVLIQTYQRDYELMERRGFLEDENRLLWIEQLETTAARLDLPDLRYQIDAQRQLSNAPYSIPANIRLHESTLNFESSLLHEGDLVDLFSGLNQLKAGVFALDHCKLLRAKSGVIASLAANFVGRCHILLYTAEDNVGQNETDNMP